MDPIAVARQAQQFFGWLDFALFVLMLLISTLIGIYFGFWGKKADTPEEYLHGGKSMSVLPVSMSLIVSFLSGIVMMGAPTEIYQFGTLYWLICVALVIVGLATYYLYLPVFYELRLTSTYEYLQLRFNRGVRIMASVLWTLYQLLYIPFVVYIPALAFSRVSGVDIYMITPIICVLCVFYTMLGGIKAVVWTDMLQGIVVLASSLAIVVLGLNQLGGIEAVWSRNYEGGRIRFFEFNPSPFERMTFWIAIIGNTFFMFGSVTLNQAMIQRYLSLPTYGKARTSIIIFTIGTMVLISICCITGLIIYARYFDCDPLTKKEIERNDQLLPHYVMEVAATVPGLPGLFVSGIFSAALSTMSSSLNSLGATVYEDLVRPFMRKDISDKRVNNIIKCIISLIGVICVLIVFVVDKLGNVLEIAMSLNGVTSGAVVGIFTFGLFYPRGNAKGALIGSIVSMLFMGWVVFGTQIARANGQLRLNKLNTSIAGCPVNDASDFNFTSSFSTTELPLTSQQPEEAFILYRISYVYYTLLGMIVMLIVGTIVSHFTNAPDLEKTNPLLFAPMVRKYVQMRKEYYSSNDPADHKLLMLVSKD